MNSGIDEAGRGCLAGPVIAACFAVNFDGNFAAEILEFLKKAKDSKKLSKIKRQEFFEQALVLRKKNLIDFGIGEISAQIIDEINILNATKQAMLLSYLNLQEKSQILVEEILVDGNFIPFEKRDKIKKIKAIIDGDAIEPIISAASIIAKVWRDRLMENFSKIYPDYSFEKHFGYGTKAHIEQIHKFGISPIHRLSFEPIKSMIKNDNS